MLLGHVFDYDSTGAGVKSVEIGQSQILLHCRGMCGMGSQMKPLTTLERRMTAHMLLLAKDEFGNHGCNDLDLRDMQLTDTEIAELHQKMAEFNRSPDDVLSGPIVPDWYLMAYLAYLQDPTVPPR